MAKIGDLFVKLGLKSDDFKKGIQQAKGDTEGFGNSIKRMSGMAKAAWAAVGAAVVKFATDAIKMTQTWGDQWAIQMEGVKGAYGAFVRQISSGEGWNNLFSNMAEAARVAREVAASMDELFERKVSLSYTEADIQRQISELQLVMRDASKSDADRMAAAQQIIALEQKLGTIKKDVAKQEAEAQKQLFMSQTGLNAEQTDFLLKNYNANRDSINQARAYLAERQRLEKKLSTATSMSASGGEESESVWEKQINDAKSALAQLDAATSQAVKDIAILTQKYDKSNDELVQNMAQAEIAVINVDTDINRASTRATAMLGSLTEAANRTSASSNGSEKGSGADLLKDLDRKVAMAMDDADLIKETEKQIEESFKALDNLEPFRPKTMSELADDDIDTTGVKKFLDEYDAALARGKMITDGFSQAVVGGFTNSCQELMNQLMGLSEANPGAVVKALLEPLADMAVRTGEIIMSEGIAVEAAKLSLTAFTGVGAIAAGAALIAIGSAAKSGLAALASNGASTGAATSASSGGSYGTSTQNVESEMTIYVSGRLSGNDILISGERTQASWAR